MRVQPEYMTTIVDKKHGRPRLSSESFVQGSLSAPWKTRNVMKTKKGGSRSDSQVHIKRKCSPVSRGHSKKKIRLEKPDIQEASLTSKGFKRHFAEHNYHDYAQLKPSEVDGDKLKGSRGGVHNPFPAVLHRMMEDATDRAFSNIVSWQDHGRAFLIHEPKAFVADVLPKYFKHSKLSSFQRQLSLYGFVRLTQDGQDRGAYYHECFLRGRAFLCSKIQRTRVKGTWVRTSSSPESEPNFYTMEKVCDRVDDLGSHQDEQSSSLSIADSQSSSDNSEDGEKDDRRQGSSNSFVQQHIDDVLAMCCSDDQEQPQQESTKRYCEESGFWHGNSKRDSEEKPPSQLLTGLKPPPAFPSTVVSQVPNKSSLSLSPLLLDDSTGLDYSSASSKACNLFMDVQWSLTSSLGAKIPSFAPIAVNDDELAQFLTDVDLETDFNTDDVMQIMSI